MAAARFLAAAAVCVILLSFAAESRESYSSGCIKVAIVICQQIFDSGAGDFPFSIFFLKVLENRIIFFCSGAEIWFSSCKF